MVPLQERADDPFHRADGATVNHDHPLLRAVGCGIGQVEAFRLVEVELDGGDGFLVTAPVSGLQVQLGSVEGGFALGPDQRWPCQSDLAPP